MTFLALVLVLASAGLHAGWNYVAKGAHGGVPFIWLTALLPALVYAPIAVGILVTQHVTLTAPQVLWAAASALLQIAYFVLLYRGYAVGDLSLVYPIARGSGPMLSTIAAVALFSERPTVLAVIGTALIGLGVFVLAGDPRKLRQSDAGPAVAYALATGAVIAAYTIWDKQGVGGLHTPPLVYNWITNGTMVLLLAPVVWRGRDALRVQWTTYRRQALVVGVFSPLSYILVLTALSFSPVSYIAPAREISILIGTLLGARMLAEGQARRRTLAAIIMVGGVVALALG